MAVKQRLMLSSALFVLGGGQALAQVGHAIPPAPTPPSAATATTPSVTPPPPASQTAPPPSTAPGGAVATAGGSEAATVGEIIVTAERRAVSLQKSALNITAVSGTDLVQKGITDARDLQTAVPGFTESHPNSNTYIGLYGLQTGAGTQYADASMTFNYGGIPLARESAAQSAFYDVERVEVLKGPQGTLYGRNATVGALNVLPAKPNWTYDGDVNVTVENYGTVNTTGHVNAPINDTLAMRVAFQTTKHDGYYSNGYDDANNYGGRASVLWKPTEDLSVLAWFDGYQDRSRGSFSTFRYYLSPTQEWINPKNPWQTVGAPGTCSNQILCPSMAQVGVGGVNAIPLPSAAAGGANASGFNDLSPNGEGRLGLAGDDGFNHVDQYIYAMEVNYRTPFGDATILGAHVDTHIDALNYSNSLQFFDNTKAYQNSIEARLASHGDTRLKWVVGGFYFYENQNAFLANAQNVGYALLNTPNLTDESFAFFGDGSFTVVPHVRLDGGIRYTHEEKTQNGQDTSIGLNASQISTFQKAGSTCFLSNINNKVEFDGYFQPSNFCVIPNAGDETFSNVSWKAGIEADLAPQSMVYGNVKTGFRSGGFTIGTSNTYKPEELTAYEVGSKNQFFDRRLQANVSAFYWDYHNEQFSQLQNYFVNGVAAGQTSYPINVDGNLYGAELSLQGVATPNDHLSADVLWTQGELYQTPTITSAVGVVESLHDVPRYDLPEWTIVAGYVHTFDLADAGLLDYGFRIHYETGTILRLIDVPSEVPGDFQSAYAKIDMDMTYHFPNGKWSVQAFVQNLTDVAIVTPGASGQVAIPTYFRPSTNPVTVRSATLEAPRTFGVRLSAKF